MRKIIIGTVLAMLAFVSPIASFAEELSEARIKELVIETIRENPRIIVDALSSLQQQENEAKAAAQSAFLENQTDLLERDPNAPVLGNPDGSVTVVEFFDYNCPYCKKASPEVEALIANDKDIRLVYREWPILGAGSVFAARAALASRKQDKYEEFHKAMMELKGRAEKATVLRAAGNIGLDIEQLLADMEAPEIEQHIDMSIQLAQSLEFNGTPSFVVGKSLVPGFVPRRQLEILVKKARESNE